VPQVRRPDGRPRFAARLDDWFHRRRERSALKRGKTAGVIPYIGYGSTEWVRVLGRVLYLPVEPESEPTDDTELTPMVSQVSRVRGWRSFTSVHVPYHPVRVLIDGVPVTEVASDRGGVIDHVVPVKLAPGWHTITLQTGNERGTHGSAKAPVYVADPAARFGLLSDVDDTILNTALPKPLVAAWNSFVVDEHARTSTPGMPVLYDHLLAKHPGSLVIYLSTGAWNVAPALSRFLERNLYPMGSLLLTDWGPTTDRWFRSGKEHKSRELDRLAREFPEIKWVLVGDDGQHDEELYEQFATAHPQNVAAVAIRQLSVGQAVLAGGRSKARLRRSSSGVPWVYGPDGATLRQQLVALELL
jgi:phosphatidate phosphatase APP1